VHEMSIAQSLFEIIREEMAKHDARVLKSIQLHIGQLSAIVPDSLSFCFEVMTSGTELEGAISVITECIAGLVDFYSKHIEKEDKHFFIPIMEYVLGGS
jgi:hydrogenase nickel insertion protein HypA